MIKVGIGLPGKSFEDVRLSAEAAAGLGYDSFSVYGDLGDHPPYDVLQASAYALRDSGVNAVGPLGIPVGRQDPYLVAEHALALEEQLPGQSTVGLVRGAFLEQIGQKPATLNRMAETAAVLEAAFARRHMKARLYLGGYGSRLLQLAGELEVEGVKLGGSVNPDLAVRARSIINNPDTKIVLGAVSVIDQDRRAARLLARNEVAKYLAVVGKLDDTLDEEDLASLRDFEAHFAVGDPAAEARISDALLDKFALAGTADDALAKLHQLNGIVDRFEFGTPHGLGKREEAIQYIGKTIIPELSN